MFNSANPWGYSWRNANGELGYAGNRKSWERPDSPYKTCVCPFLGCGVEIKRRLLDEHLTACAYRPTKCEWCATELTVLASIRHRSRCTKRPTPCPNGCLGRCGQVIVLPFDTIAEHRKKCLLEVIDCSHPTCFIRRTRGEIKYHEETDHTDHILNAILKSPQKLNTKLMLLPDGLAGVNVGSDYNVGDVVDLMKIKQSGAKAITAYASPSTKKEKADYTIQLKDEFSYARSPTENGGRLFRYVRPPPRPLTGSTGW